MPDVKVTFVVEGTNSTEQAFDAISGAASRTGGSVKSAFSGVGGLIQNAFSFAVGGLIESGIRSIGNAFGEIKSAMIDGNAEFERYQVQFGVLLGSADAAKKRLAELADFGARTPFNLPEVVQADKILQSFGLHAEDAAQKFGFSGEEIRTIAGDVASGTGASFNEIATNFGRFASGATGEALMRFQEMGIVTKKQLADMGLTFDAGGALVVSAAGGISKAAQKAQDSLPGLNTQLLIAKQRMAEMEANSKTSASSLLSQQKKVTDLENSISKANQTIASGATSNAQTIDAAFGVVLKAAKEKYGGMMDAQSQTFEGMVSNLQDWMGSTGRILGAPIFDVLKENLKGLLEFLGSDAAKGAITTAATAIAGAIQSIIVWGKQAVEWVKSNWPAIQNVFNVVFGVVSGLVQTFINDVLPGIISAGGAIVSWLQANWPQVQAVIGTVIQFIVKLINGFVNETLPSIIAFAGQVVAWVRENWPKIQAAVEPVINTIVAAVMHFATEVLPQIIAFVGQVVAYVSDNWPQIYADIKPIVDAVIAIIGQLYTTGKTILGALFEVVKSIFGGIGDTAGASSSDLLETISGVWNVIKTVIIAALGIIQSVLKVIMDVIRGDWGAVWNDIVDVLKNVGVILSSVLASLFTVIGALATMFLNNMKTSFTNTWTGIQTLIIEVTTSIGNWLGNVWTGIKTEAARIWNSVVSFFKDTWDSISKRISDTWRDIKNGTSMTWETIKTWLRVAWESIGQSAASAWNTIKQKISDAWTAIKDFFTWENLRTLGENIIKGIANGVSNAWGWLRDAVTKVANDAINTIKHVFGISSPSRVFAGFGANMMQGLAQGIINNADLPQVALSASLSAQNMAGSLARGSSVSNTSSATTNFNYSPTYLGGPSNEPQSSFAIMRAMAVTR